MYWEFLRVGLPKLQNHTVIHPHWYLPILYLGVEVLLLLVKRCQLMWVGHFIRMLPGGFLLEVHQAHPTGRRPQADPENAGEIIYPIWPWNIWESPGGAGKREEHVDYFAEFAAATTWSWKRGRKWMDGWIKFICAGQQSSYQTVVSDILLVMYIQCNVQISFN